MFSESTSRISAGEITLPHDGQAVSRAALTFAWLILFLCIYYSTKSLYFPRIGFTTAMLVPLLSLTHTLP